MKLDNPILTVEKLYEDMGTREAPCVPWNGSYQENERVCHGLPWLTPLPYVEGNGARMVVWKGIEWPGVGCSPYEIPALRTPVPYVCSTLQSCGCMIWKQCLPKKGDRPRSGASEENHAAAIDREGMMPSEIDQPEKEKYRMTSLIGGI